MREDEAEIYLYKQDGSFYQVYDSNCNRPNFPFEIKFISE